MPKQENLKGIQALDIWHTTMLHLSKILQSLGKDFLVEEIRDCCLVCTGVMCWMSHRMFTETSYYSLIKPISLRKQSIILSYSVFRYIIFKHKLFSLNLLWSVWHKLLGIQSPLQKHRNITRAQALWIFHIKHTIHAHHSCFKKM